MHRPHSFCRRTQNPPAIRVPRALRQTDSYSDDHQHLASNAGGEARRPQGAGVLRQDHLAHLEALLLLRPGARRPVEGRAEGGSGRVRRRDHGGARRPGGRDGGVPDDAAPRLLAARGAHHGVQPAEEHRRLVLGRDGPAPRVQKPEDGQAGAARLGRGARDHHVEQGAPRRRAPVRARPRVRLLRLQDPREVVPAADARQGRRAAAADADARGDRHPQARPRRGGRDVRAHVAALVHPRHADDVQRGDAAAADVVVLPPLDEGGLDRRCARAPTPPPPPAPASDSDAPPRPARTLTSHSPRPSPALQASSTPSRSAPASQSRRAGSACRRR